MSTQTVRRQLSTGPSFAAAVSAETKRGACRAQDGSLSPATVRARQPSRILCIAMQESGTRCLMLGCSTLWHACRCASTPQKRRSTLPKPRKGFQSLRKSALYKSCTATFRTFRGSPTRKIVQNIRRMATEEPDGSQWSAPAHTCGCRFVRDRSAVYPWFLKAA